MGVDCEESSGLSGGGGLCSIQAIQPPIRTNSCPLLENFVDELVLALWQGSSGRSPGRSLVNPTEQSVKRVGPSPNNTPGLCPRISLQ